MRLFISFAALLTSVLLLQLSTGGVGPLDALSAITLDFGRGEIGLLGSAHFFGFFIGCWWAPRLMGSVGHSRAFAALTAAGAIGLIGHMVIVDPIAWALMRVASGICVAGCYTVIESWLQARVTNETRGRMMGAYRVVDISGSLAAQLLIGFLEPGAYVSYNILAILCCASLLPLTLSTAPQPETPAAPRLRPRLAIAMSPLATLSVVVAGVSAAAFRMIGPVYGQEVGLGTDEIALFLAIYVFGGAVSQFPLGWLADKFDRRHVLIGISLAAVGACGLNAAAPGGGGVAIYLAALLFGAATFPIYSVAAAHAHDFATDEERVELSAALMFFYAIGAIASPVVTSWIIARFGPQAMFAYVAIAHVALLLFGLIRMAARPTSARRVPYVYTPRTSFIIGRLLRRGR